MNNQYVKNVVNFFDTNDSLKETHLKDKNKKVNKSLSNFESYQLNIIEELKKLSKTITSNNKKQNFIQEEMKDELKENSLNSRSRSKPISKFRHFM